jgi:hypothetical protein
MGDAQQGPNTASFNLDIGPVARRTVNQLPHVDLTAGDGDGDGDNEGGKETQDEIVVIDD